jgi:hypothetical protein
MKHIKVYIVTWQRNDVLNELLKNLFVDSTFKDYKNCEVNIINNHSSLEIEDCYKDKVKIHHNMCRVDWSCGNLSQDFNFALIDGFRDLKNPDAEIVVTLQNDAILHPNWADCVVEKMKKYEYLVGMLGDNIVAYKANHIRKAGLWDENYAGVYIKEGDYHIRSLIYNKENVSINDKLHALFCNEEEITLDLVGHRGGFTIKENLTHRHIENPIHGMLREEQGLFASHPNHYWKWKWKDTKPDYPLVKGSVGKQHGWLINWSKAFVDNPPSPPKVPQFIKYPFFEKDIDDLKGKGYITDGFSEKQKNITYKELSSGD